MLIAHDAHDAIPARLAAWLLVPRDALADRIACRKESASGFAIDDDDPVGAEPIAGVEYAASQHGHAKELEVVGGHGPLAEVPARDGRALPFDRELIE